jgi:PAS domain S-box-containing protein
MTDTILQSISDGVFTVDSSWHITSFNKAAERITGIRRKEAIGKLCHEVFKSNMCERECPLRRTMKTGKPIIDKKGYCLSLAGEKIPISVSTALLIDGDGKIRGGAETFRDLREIEALKEQLEDRKAAGGFQSRNTEMRKILELLSTIAESTATVLIEGETGTGKEVIARRIHSLSDRAEGPFVGINCGALPDSLLESELFGYKKGAFTGADKNKEGRFKRAQNGTLFLDEIGDVSQALQVKLLRVLQEKEYEVLGGTKAETTNARILCATNKDLAALVRQGEFRQDLYYRIKVINIALPPLRARKEDIPFLAERFLRRYAQQSGKTVKSFTPEVYDALLAYPWPGNIRELENVVERAVVLCRKEQIDPSLLPPEILNPSRRNTMIQPTHTVQHTADTAIKTGIGIHAEKAALERSRIVDTLRSCGCVCSEAAHLLKIDRATLYRKIKALDIDLNALRSSRI